MENASPETPPPRPRKNRRWIWFFLTLTGLCVAAVTIILVYNFRQQLTPAQLEAAEALWQRKGPKTYTITYEKNIAGLPREVIQVRVKNDKVDYATDNDLPLPEDKLAYYDVPAMFRDLRQFLDARERSGDSWVYLHALFDPD